jgi:predicted transcriptional regulator
MSKQTIRKISEDGRLLEQNRFIKVETQIRDDKSLRDIRGGPLEIYFLLASFIDDHGECYPSTAKLSEISGYKKRKIQYSIRTLIKFGWLSIVTKGSNKKGVKRANRYKLLRYVNYGNSWRDVSEIVSETVELEDVECLEN